MLPTPRPKKVRPQRTACVVISMRDDGCVLLERRPPAGIWGGLWTFPQFEDRDGAAQWIEGPGGGGNVDELPQYTHSFTHFDLALQPLLIRGAEPASAVADRDRYCWYDPSQPAKIGLAKPAVDLIRALDTRRPVAQRQATLL